MNLWNSWKQNNVQLRKKLTVYKLLRMRQNKKSFYFHSLWTMFPEFQKIQLQFKTIK